ncbi:hypothetical protein Ocin01_10192 [Orchesella cincta]|uniref:Uncharacterized protein n=1 Tax=Orchesella cincta TaxID=48709 RepID=A0A1D2MU90_ORCCI|nr:hypothetical protein Ocin01_10192 [Orchesella cincta]
MSETKIFCSVIIFTLGIYTILLLQYELYKLNHLNSVDNESACNITTKTKLDLARLNCGSASELRSLKLQQCSEIPCDIVPNVTYNVELAFVPSREVSTLEIHTFVSERRDLKYLHKETVHVHGNDVDVTSLKFSFTFPSHSVFKPRTKKSRKCSHLHTYLLGVEIWDAPSGIGEVCLVVPINVYWTNEPNYSSSSSNYQTST